MKQKALTTKGTIHKLDYNKIKNVFIKTRYICEDISIITDKGLTYNVYEEFLQIQKKKVEIIEEIMIKRLEHDLSQGGIQVSSIH